MPGVATVQVIQDAGAEIHWAHDEIVFLAAESEEIAADALAAIVVEYEVLPHYVRLTRAAAIGEVGRDGVSLLEKVLKVGHFRQSLMRGFSFCCFST